MNLIGKIFVVLIFVMSLVFMTQAMAVYSTHKNWKEEITRTPAEVKAGQTVGYQHALREAREENERLRNQYQQLQATLATERAAQLSALSKAESQYQALRVTSDTLKGENTRLAESLAKSVEELKVQQDNLANLTTEVGNLRNEIRVAIANRDEQFTLASKLTDDLNSAQVQLKSLTERNTALSEQVATARTLLHSAGIPPGTDASAAPPPVEGRVTGVQSNSMVEVSLGSHDGVLVGHELDISRGSTYLGRVRVVESQPDRAVGTILPQFRKGVIQRGDRVDTRS